MRVSWVDSTGHEEVFHVGWKYYMSPEGMRVTLCIILQMVGPTKVTLAQGEAVCSVKDNFDKERGRKISLARALQYTEDPPLFDKREKAWFWENYRLMGKKARW